MHGLMRGGEQTVISRTASQSVASRLLYFVSTNPGMRRVEINPSMAFSEQLEPVSLR